MRNFMQVGNDAPVLPLLMALQRKPELWNRATLRQDFPGSPHAAVDDIWLRMEDIGHLDPADPDLGAKSEAAERIWQPAWFELPEARGLVVPLMQRVGAYELARVIITRLPPGKSILPHADTQGAYANLPDIARYHIVLQGLPGSLFHAGDETVTMLTGSVWWFDAHQVHACDNFSADDRLHLLVDVRVI